MKTKIQGLENAYNIMTESILSTSNILFLLNLHTLQKLYEYIF